MTDVPTGKIFTYGLIKFEIDIDENKYRIIDWIEYFGDGSNTEDNETKEFNYIKPETRFEHLLNESLKYSKK